MYSHQLVKKSVELFLKGIGHPNWQHDPNTKDTPERVAKMWKILLGGYHIDPKKYLRTFPATTGDMVIVKDIPAVSFCAHHLLPFVGRIAIGYIPNHKLLGLSKLARFARSKLKKLQLQESLTAEIADTLNKTLEPKGVMIYAEMTHSCMSFRGVRSHGCVTVTSAVRGIFEKDAKVRNEFMEAIRRDNDIYKY